ncbi:MAG: hypothetical protein RM368_03015 [Nostoc sp. DedSLP03]|nr:hypothetical protein [Nostoc sp. DedSLP03]
MDSTQKRYKQRLSPSPAQTRNAVLEAPPPELAAAAQLKCISSPEAGNESLTKLLA